MDRREFLVGVSTAAALAPLLPGDTPEWDVHVDTMPPHEVARTRVYVDGKFVGGVIAASVRRGEVLMYDVTERNPVPGDNCMATGHAKMPSGQRDPVTGFLLYEPCGCGADQRVVGDSPTDSWCLPLIRRRGRVRIERGGRPT